MRNIVILNSLHFSYPLPILMRVSYNTLIVKQNTSDYYKYTNKPEKSITFSSQPIRPSFSNKNISGRDILYPALRSTTIPYPDPYKRFFLAP